MLTPSTFFEVVVDTFAQAELHAIHQSKIETPSDIEWMLGISAPEDVTIDTLNALKIIYDQYQALYLNASSVQ